MGAEETALCGCFRKVQYERSDFLPQAAGIQATSEQVKSRLITKLWLSKGVLFDNLRLLTLIDILYATHMLISVQKHKKSLNFSRIYGKFYE